MYDLWVSLGVFTFQVVLGITVLNYYSSRVKGLVRSKTFIEVTTITSLLIYILMLIIKQPLYEKELTESVILQSVYINISLIGSLRIEDVVKFVKNKKMVLGLKVLRTICYLYSVLGFGFYYLVFIFRLGISEFKI